MSRDRIVGTLDTGCRLGEMLKIQNRHVLWDTHQIVIPAEHTKDAESRRIEPKARLAQLLKRRRFLGPKAFVFGTATGGYQGTIRTAWESLVLLAHGFEPTRTRARGRVNREQLAGIDLHWHDLRHEAACRRLAGGLDLRAIQLLLGHADLKTTQPYLNVTDEELRKTMQQKAVDPKIISPGLSAGSASRNGCAEFRLTRCRQEAPLPLRRYVCMLESYV